MISLGYKTVKVKEYSELERIEKDTNIEVLIGYIGSGKSKLLKEYFNDFESDIMFITSEIHNDFFNEFDALNLDKNTSKLEIDTFLNKKTKKKVVVVRDIACFINDDEEDILVSSLKIIFDYCSNNNIELLIDEIKSSIIAKDLANCTNTIRIVMQKNISEKNTIDKYFDNVIYSEIDYLKVAKLYKAKDGYSGNVSLRIPKSLHKKLSEEAKQEDISLNQYLLYILASRH